VNSTGETLVKCCDVPPNGSIIIDSAADVELRVFFNGALGWCLVTAPVYCVDAYYISNTDVSQKFKDKLDYLLTTPEDVIPLEYSLNKWTQYLPPLVPFKLKPITNVSEEFKKECLRNFRSGATCQRDKILIIKSKIIFFSLALQELIQKVVDRKKLLLMNSAKEPFLENSCCSEKGSISTIKFSTTDKIICTRSC
jgi:hypothetical protein